MLNNSAQTPVKAIYNYAPEDGCRDYGIGLFDSDLDEYAAETDASPSHSLHDPITTETIAAGEEDSHWLMFTESAGEELSDAFVRIGTLAIEVIPA